MKRVRMFVHDASIPRTRYATDEVLEANSPGKVVALGEVWDGYLKSKVDMQMDEPPPIRGFKANHVVGAEPAPVVLNLGKLWRGALDMRSDMLFANQMGTRDDAAGERVDLTEVYRANESLLQALGTEPIDMKRVQDAVRQRREAVDKVRDGKRTGDHSRQSAQTAIRDALHAGNQATRERIRAINDANHARCAGATGRAATTDSIGQIRDAEHAVRTATDQRTLIQSMNHLNRLRAAANDHTPGTTHEDRRRAMDLAHMQTRPARRTPAEINEANRRFWAAQK